MLRGRGPGAIRLLRWRGKVYMVSNLKKVGNPKRPGSRKRDWRVGSKLTFMKYQIISYLLLCVFMQVAFGKAFSQTPYDSIQNKAISTIEKNVGEVKDLVRKTDSTVIGLAKDAVKKAKDSLENSDSASVFNAWKYATAHPETLYAKQCDKCERNWIITIAVFLFLILFLYKAFSFFIKSALCRDESYSAEGVLRPDKERPYSYSRVQMFGWSVIIICCYGIFYAMYGRLIPLSPTCIILLGGSLAMMAFGKSIDNSQKEKDKEINEGQPTRHQDLQPTQGLLTDILSDENGISMHRLQSVAFNIIYGLGFIGFFMTAIVCKQYPFVEFEGWQLTLLGISAGGYLGLKTSENGKDSQGERANKAQANAANNEAGLNR